MPPGPVKVVWRTDYIGELQVGGGAPCMWVIYRQGMGVFGGRTFEEALEASGQKKLGRILGERLPSLGAVEMRRVGMLVMLTRAAGSHP